MSGPDLIAEEAAAREPTRAQRAKRRTRANRARVAQGKAPRPELRAGNCPHCDGWGEIGQGRTRCPACGGTGRHG